MQSIRNRIQKEATQAIIQNKFNGIIYVSPRVGKSKIVVDAIKKLKSKKILITAPYNTILDSWTTEFEKWDVNTTNITLINQRSLSKINVEEYHYIISDEVHTLSEAQIEILQNATKILGLTGSLSKESKKILKDTLSLEPIFTFSVEEAIDAGIVSDYVVYLVPVTLDNKDKYIEAGTAKQKFYTTEYANYQYLTSQFDKFKRLSWNNKKFEAVKMQFASKRASMLYNAKSKIEKAISVIAKHQRCLIFTARTEIADLFAKSYHSKSTENTLEQFKNGEIDKLAVCEMTNMGITIPNLKIGIFHQIKSSEESAIQKVMRMCNLEGDDVAEIYIIYFANTVDEEWVKKATQGLNAEKIQILGSENLIKS
jgi:superfamily II DNA or RNA helicase